ncbi:hypothetical protein [Modestobacter sp. SYSU DS0511]
MDEHGGAAATSAPSADPVADPARRRRRTDPRLVVAGLLVVLLAIGAVVMLVLRGHPLTVDGRYVTDPPAVLADADRRFADYVDQRTGARGPDTRCWFQLIDPDGTEVARELLCGPALFVGGNPGRSWLRFPLTVTAAGGDVRLRTAGLPADPEPQAVDDADLLFRPDGSRPPSGTAGLRVPEVPRAEPGFTAVGPFPALPWTAPVGPARLSGPAAAVTVTGLATPDVVGTGDAARRPADGQRFLAVRYTVDPGEGRSTAPPALSYQVPGAAPVPVAPALVAPGSTVEAVVAVPVDATQADLVVLDDGVEQRLSLLDGSPGPGNVQVLARTNRTAEVGASRQVDADFSAPGRVTASFPVTVRLDAATLQWFAGPDGSAQPTDPSRAHLVLDVTMALPEGDPGAVPVELLTLVLPDGTRRPGIDLSRAADRVLAAFDVPAGFTDGEVVVRGRATFPDGLTADLGAGEARFPVAIPAG